MAGQEIVPNDPIESLLFSEYVLIYIAGPGKPGVVTQQRAKALVVVVGTPYKTPVPG